jgi:uncharacterized protein with HEPN domain
MRDNIYLFHMLDAIQKIELYIPTDRKAFMADSLRQDAVIRQLEIIGEATKKLSLELRSKYPTIPWRRIAGLRDVLIHEYMGVDLNAIWELTQQNIPELKTVLELMLTDIKD